MVVQAKISTHKAATRVLPRGVRVVTADTELLCWILRHDGHYCGRQKYVEPTAKDVLLSLFVIIKILYKCTFLV